MEPNQGPQLETVRLTGPEPPAPLLPPVVQKNFNKLHREFVFHNHVFPVIQAKRDLMACTIIDDSAAYLFPIMSEIETTNTSSSINNNNLSVPVSPHCVIVTPTLKSINHIKHVADKISRNGECVKTMAINDWHLSEDLKEEVKKGCNILVARPQSLLQLIEEKLVNFMEVKVVVMEEAHILLNAFYSSEIDVVMSELSDRDHRQTLMFSKYLPDKIQENGKEFLKQDYLFASLALRIRHNVGPTEAALDEMRLEDLELEVELLNINRSLNLYKSKESECEKMLEETIKQQNDLLARNKGELNVQKFGVKLGAQIWDLGPLTREMNLIALDGKKQDLQAELEEVRKKLRDLVRETEVLEIEKIKVVGFISQLEDMVI